MELSVDEMIGFFKKSFAEQEAFLSIQKPDTVRHFLSQLNIVELNKMMANYKSEDMRNTIESAMRNTDKV